jgi:hypothetical protein
VRARGRDACGEGRAVGPNGRARAKIRPVRTGQAGRMTTGQGSGQGSLPKAVGGAVIEPTSGRAPPAPI